MTAGALVFGSLQEMAGSIIPNHSLDDSILLCSLLQMNIDQQQSEMRGASDAVSTLNNMGVAAMERGNADLALQLYKLALDAKLKEMATNELVQNCLVHYTTPSQREEFRQRVDQANTNLSQMPIPPAAAENGEIRHNPTTATSAYQRKLQHDRSGSEAVFVYLRPMILSNTNFVTYHGEQERAAEEEQQKSTRTAIESAIILYNLALVYHSKSFSAARNSGQILAKALGFYKLALQLVKDILNCGRLTVDPRLIMGIVNNLGHIHLVLGNLAASRRLFTNLSSILYSMSASGDNRCVDENDWAGLVLNTMFVNETKVAAAA